MNLELSVSTETPKYQLVDVTIVTTDGKHATFEAVVEVAGEGLVTRRGEFTRERDPRWPLIGGTVEFFPSHDAVADFLFCEEELAAELREACDYQRDCLREMN